MSNQKQIGLAAHVYSVDNNGRVVGDYNSPGSMMLFATKYLNYTGGQSGLVSHESYAQSGSRIADSVEKCPHS